MDRLHSDIIHKILSHVPADSVLNCKLVCKEWGSLLSRFKVGLLFLVYLDGETNAQLYYGDYREVINNEHGRFSHKTLAKTNHPPIKMVKHQPVIVGSCNGLVCISIPEPYSRFRNDPVYVCNPTTGEYVNLPALSPKDGEIGSGFGYFQKTNEYKIVRIHYPADPRFSGISQGSVQVYTLGDGVGWRNLATITDKLYLPGVCGNGVIYFIDDDNWKLVTFDLATEEFQVLPQQPPCFGIGVHNSVFHVKVLGGCLYVVHRERGKSVDLWSYKNKFWSKEFSIPPCEGPGKENCYWIISLTKSNQVLFWCKRTVLCCYDPKTGTVSEIASDDDWLNINTFQAIPHMNTYVSLEDLGVPSNQASVCSLI